MCNKNPKPYEFTLLGPLENLQEIPQEKIDFIDSHPDFKNDNNVNKDIQELGIAICLLNLSLTTDIASKLSYEKLHEPIDFKAHKFSRGAIDIEFLQIVIKKIKGNKDYRFNIFEWLLNLYELHNLVYKYAGNKCLQAYLESYHDFFVEIKKEKRILDYDYETDRPINEALI